MQAATGAQAEAAAGNGDMGSAYALQVNFAANNVGDRAIAAASGVGGTQGSERIAAADVTGASGSNGAGTIRAAVMQAVTGAQAHNAIGKADTGSADALQVNYAANSVGERVVAAASGVGNAQGSGVTLTAQRCSSAVLSSAGRSTR